MLKFQTIRIQASFCEYVSSNFNAINAHYNLIGLKHARLELWDGFTIPVALSKSIAHASI